MSVRNDLVKYWNRIHEQNTRCNGRNFMLQEKKEVKKNKNNVIVVH